MGQKIPAWGFMDRKVKVDDCGHKPEIDVGWFVIND